MNMRDIMRLVEVAADIPDCHGPCLYHATYRRHLRNIMQNGLGAAPAKNFRISRPGAVYMTGDPEVAENYAKEGLIKNGENDDIIILEIDQQQLNPALLHEDPNDAGDFGYQEEGPSEDGEEYDNSYKSYEYHGVVPPSALSVYYQ